MVNPASIMKIMNLKNKFAANHPKFVSFINYCLNGGIQEGTVIEITEDFIQIRFIKHLLGVYIWEI